MSDSIHLRNAKALEAALRTEILARQELTGRLASLEAQFTMIRQATTDMQAQLQVLRAMSVGTGPIG